MAENHQPGSIAALGTAFAVMTLLAGSLAAQVQYTIRFPAPQTHYALVDAVFPVPQTASVEFFLPVWTPGSSLVREYARNVEELAFRNAEGKALPFTKSAKNRWRVESAGSPKVH